MADQAPPAPAPAPQAPAPAPQPAPNYQATTSQAPATDLAAELSRLRAELAEAKGAQSQATAAAVAAELASAKQFKAATEARIRHDAIKEHLPEGLPAKAADLIVRGISSKLGDFEVDVTAWSAKDAKAIKEAIAKEDLASLVQPTSPNPSILPPGITQAPQQQRAAGPLHVAGERQAKQDPRLDSLVAVFSQLLKK